jgi:hypothetical protein
MDVLLQIGERETELRETIVQVAHACTVSVRAGIVGTATACAKCITEATRLHGDTAAHTVVHAGRGSRRQLGKAAGEVIELTCRKARRRLTGSQTRVGFDDRFDLLEKLTSCLCQLGGLGEPGVGRGASRRRCARSRPAPQLPRPVDDRSADERDHTKAKDHLGHVCGPGSVRIFQFCVVGVLSCLTQPGRTPAGIPPPHPHWAMSSTGVLGFDRYWTRPVALSQIEEST